LGIKCVVEVLAYRATTVTSWGKDYREAPRISTNADDAGTYDISNELELQPEDKPKILQFLILIDESHHL
jgi:hypothetical protein